MPSGIGLFRTELQFMVAKSLPRTGEQVALYRAVLDAAGKRPVDVPHARHRRRQGAALHAQVEEENPALGWRAIRLGLDRPGAAAQPDPRAAARRRRPRAAVMFPMIATVEEFDKARGWSKWS